MLMDTFFKVLTPPATEGVRSRFYNRKTMGDKDLVALKRLYSKISYIATKLGGFELLKVNQNTDTIDFKYKGEVITNKYPGDIIDSIKEVGKQRERFYETLLPLLEPKVRSRNLVALREELCTQKHSNLLYVLSNCAKLKGQMPSLEFENINTLNYNITFSLNGVTYTKDLNTLKKLVNKAKET